MLDSVEADFEELRARARARPVLSPGDVLRRRVRQALAATEPDVSLPLDVAAAAAGSPRRWRASGSGGPRG
jgi:hypothetical protein